jgi:hypothetical protein
MPLQSGNGSRIVRVGTHALVTGSRSTLRRRLGTASRPGIRRCNHRGSIFRLLIGQALLARGEVAQCVSWGVKGAAGKASLALNISHETLAAAEAPVEMAVTNYLGTMPFLWLDIDDEPGPDSLRGVIERNARCSAITSARLSIHHRPAG